MEALGLVDAGEHFDAAIVDLEMPGMDGVQVIEALKERLPALPIGLCSASDRLDALSAEDLASADFVKQKTRPIGELVQATCHAVYSRGLAARDTGGGSPTKSGIPPASAKSSKARGSAMRPASGWQRRAVVLGEIESERDAESG
jgi:DNA-binding NarL/FixJ family response regulator